MFTKIQHIGYQVNNLEAAIAWFGRAFGGVNAGGGVLSAGRGRNAFVHFGQIEVELLELAGHQANIPADTLVMHHVGYVVEDINEAAARLRAKGLRFAAEKPATNVLGQQVLYFDPASANGDSIHLTQLPAQPNTAGYGQGVPIDSIVHAGYVVDNLQAAVDWYIEKFDGKYIGGGMSRRGVNNAFINFGAVQVELLEQTRPEQLQGKKHAMDHVGYVCRDINAALAQCEARGLKRGEAGPRQNSVKQTLCYFDTATSQGTQIHLTQLPD